MINFEEEKCENCNNIYVCEFKNYFDKSICYNCIDNYCLNCESKLQFKEIKKENTLIKLDINNNKVLETCQLCGRTACYNCFVDKCNICDNTGNIRCSHCYGSTIQLCCGCICCFQCLIFKNDNENDQCYKIQYCQKHDNYVCGVCDNKNHQLLSKHNEPIRPSEYIIKNSDMCTPKLNKYTKFCITNIGYRGPSFM